MDFDDIDLSLKTKFKSEKDIIDSKIRANKSLARNNLICDIIKNNCIGCNSSNKNLYVLPEGSVFSDIMIVLSEPSELEGKIHTTAYDNFGRILDVIIDKLGLKRDNIYITNIIKCAKNCNLKDDAIVCAFNFLQREINIIKPKKIIAFGDLAISILNSMDLDKVVNIETEMVHGKIINMNIDNNNIKVLQTFDIRKLMEVNGAMYSVYQKTLWNEIYNFIKGS